MNVPGGEEPNSSDVNMLTSPNVVCRGCQVTYKTRRAAPFLKLEETITGVHVQQQIVSRVGDRLQNHQRSLEKYRHLILITQKQ